MRLTAFHRDAWFGFRLALTAILAFILVFGRLPLAGATEEPAGDTQLTVAGEGEGDGAADGTETTSQPTEPAVQQVEEVEETEAPAEVEQTEPPAAEKPKKQQSAPVQELEEEAAPLEEGTQVVESPRRSATKVAGAETIDSGPAPTDHQVGHVGNASADLDQWANLAAGSWQNGNLNQSNSAYVENDTVPFRMRLDGLGTGITHTLTIEWDVTKAGTHAYDYIQSYDATESNANPCTQVSGPTPLCVEATPSSTFAIPTDSQVTSPVTQPPTSVPQASGEFTMWGANITNVSGYSGAGTTATDGSRRITVTFTSLTDDAVIAWGGHISSRIQWNPQLTAAQIAGSPYHMRLFDINGKSGNQDRSLSANSVFMPLIEVDKSADYTSAQAGTLVTYTYVIKNVGEMDLTNVTLVDDKLGTITLPQTTLFSSCQNDTCNGETITVEKTYTLTNDDATNSPLVNEATTTGTASSGDVVTDQDTWSIAVSPRPVPALTFAKTSDATGGEASSDGGSFNYELEVTNGTGPLVAAATGVVIEDTIPAGLDIDSATWTVDGGVTNTNCDITGAPDVVCSIGTLAAGATATVTIGVTADGSVCNTVTNAGLVRGTNFTTQNDSVDVDLICPDVDVVKTASETEIDTETGSLSYEITVDNDAAATDTARDVAVSDQVPAGLAFTGVSWTLDTGAGPVAQATGCAESATVAGLVECDLGDLAPGDVAVITITADADGSGTCGATLTNTADLSGDNFANDSDSADVDLICEIVTFDKTSNAPAGGVPADGGTFDYILSLANDPTATGPAEAVVITDEVPAGLTIVDAVWRIDTAATTGTDSTCGQAGAVVTCSVGDVEPGETAVVTISVIGDDSTCGPVTNDGLASGANFPNDGDTVTVELTCPDVTLEKEASSTDVGPTDDYSYTITATNNGTGPTKDLIITDDDLDPDLIVNDVTFTNDGSAAAACAPGVGAGNTIECNVGPLAGNGAVAVVTINVTATPDACGSVPNVADSNYSPESNEVVVTIACPAPPGILLTKTASPTTAGVGDTVTYTYLIENTGGWPLSSITLVDDKLGDIPLDEEQTSLPVGGSTVVTAEHVITQANVDAGSLVNVATAAGTAPTGARVQSTSQARVSMPQNPDIEVVKSANVTGVDVGETITYTYVITNTGNVTLTDVALVDDVIGQIVDAGAGISLAPGESMTVDSDYVATDADADNQQVTNIATATGQPPTGAPVIHSDTITVPVGRTLVQPTDFLTVAKDVVGEHEGRRYSYTVDCGNIALGKHDSFSLPAGGGSHEVGVAMEVGTECRVVETSAGGADSTTAAVNNGDPRSTRSVVVDIREGGSTVSFTNTFGAAPVPEPREPELPATGADTTMQLLVALAALLLGGTLVKVTRPRRRGWLRA